MRHGKKSIGTFFVVAVTNIVRSAVETNMRVPFIMLSGGFRDEQPLQPVHACRDSGDAESIPAGDDAGISAGADAGTATGRAFLRGTAVLQRQLHEEIQAPLRPTRVLVRVLKPLVRVHPAAADGSNRRRLLKGSSGSLLVSGVSGVFFAEEIGPDMYDSDESYYCLGRAFLPRQCGACLRFSWKLFRSSHDPKCSKSCRIASNYGVDYPHKICPKCYAMVQLVKPA